MRRAHWPAVRSARTSIGPGRIRAQFSLVIGLLSFLPNVVVVLFLASAAGIGDHVLVIGWLLVVALASGVVGYVLSRALLMPLTRLTTELGQGDALLPHDDDPSEVRSLRGAFRGLLDRLAEERDRRNAFMATLVHDLKTPLIATGHLVRVLHDQPLGTSEREHITERLLDENRRLLELVQHMAEAHRLEREVVPIRPEPTDLHALARAVVNRAQPRAATRGVTLSVSGTGHADADVTQLDRALSNLVDNALRYARQSVELHVNAHAVSVEDDGPGLADTLERLAQPFNSQPVDIAGHRYTAGTAGLGLFIVRRIAEAHGGRLSYRRTEGRTILTVDLLPPPTSGAGVTPTLPARSTLTPESAGRNTLPGGAG